MAGVNSGCSLTKLNTNPTIGRNVPRLLRREEIADGLRGLSGWKQEGKFIVKVFEFDEFMDGIEFVNRVADVAEEEEHHPDIEIRYTAVTLSLQTHSEGGVTEWDLELAKAVEKMSEGRAARRVKHR